MHDELKGEGSEDKKEILQTPQGTDKSIEMHLFLREKKVEGGFDINAKAIWVSSN